MDNRTDYCQYRSILDNIFKILFAKNIQTEIIDPRFIISTYLICFPKKDNKRVINLGNIT